MCQPQRCSSRAQTDTDNNPKKTAVTDTASVNTLSPPAALPSQAELAHKALTDSIARFQQLIEELQQQITKKKYRHRPGTGR